MANNDFWGNLPTDGTECPLHPEAQEVKKVEDEHKKWLRKQKLEIKKREQEREKRHQTIYNATCERFKSLYGYDKIETLEDRDKFMGLLHEEEEKYDTRIAEQKKQKEAEKRQKQEAKLKRKGVLLRY